MVEKSGQVSRAVPHTLNVIGLGTRLCRCYLAYFGKQVRENFIIATGITSTLQDFIATAYKYIGKDRREFFSPDPSLL